jgi:hypothetical protein
MNKIARVLFMFFFKFNIKQKTAPLPIALKLTELL